MLRFAPHFAVLLLATTIVACQGKFQATNDDVSSTDESVDDERVDLSDPMSAECTGTVAGDAPLRRLTEREFNNAIRDIFPGVEFPHYQLAPDERVGPFTANVSAAVGDLGAQSYFDVSQDVAERVRQRRELFLCEGAMTPECAHATLEWFAPRLFRQPLSMIEMDRWHALLDAGLDAGYGNRQSTAYTLEAMLQSPRFLYRAEASARAEAATDRVALDDVELANRLSFTIAGTIPDEQLLAAAERGELTGPDAPQQLERHARRLLEKSETRRHLTSLFREWLGLADLASVAGESDLDSELLVSMEGEIDRFLDHILWERNGSIEELLTADYTFVDQRLADLYGVPFSGDDPDQYVRVSHPDDRRIGVLTLPGVLAAHATGTASIFRGVFISNVFLCTPVPERPPQEVIDAAVEADDSLTYAPGDPERQVAQARIDHPSCGGCHRSMESVGLVFDNYGFDGSWREVDGYDNPVSDEGEVFATEHTNGAVDGAASLARRLAQSPDVETCATRNWFRYLFARGLEQHDVCTVQVMLGALHDTGDMREMLISVVSTDAFRYRAPTDKIAE